MNDDIVIRLRNYSVMSYPSAHGGLMERAAEEIEFLRKELFERGFDLAVEQHVFEGVYEQKNKYEEEIEQLKKELAEEKQAVRLLQRSRERLQHSITRQNYSDEWVAELQKECDKWRSMFIELYEALPTTEDMHEAYKKAVYGRF